MGSTSEYNRKYIQKIGKKKFRARQRIKMQEWRRKNPEKYLIQAARSRATMYGLRFTLTEDDIQIPTHCPILGIKLRKNIGGMKDNSVSIDRINNRRGYTPDNIVVVSLRANRLKSDASLDELKKITKFYSNRK